MTRFSRLFESLLGLLPSPYSCSVLKSGNRRLYAVPPNNENYNWKTCWSRTRCITFPCLNISAPPSSYTKPLNPSNSASKEVTPDTSCESELKFQPHRTRNAQFVDENAAFNRCNRCSNCRIFRWTYFEATIYRLLSFFLIGYIYCYTIYPYFAQNLHYLHGLQRVHVRSNEDIFIARLAHKLHQAIAPVRLLLRCFFDAAAIPIGLLSNLLPIYAFSGKLDSFAGRSTPLYENIDSGTQTQRGADAAVSGTDNEQTSSAASLWYLVDTSDSQYATIRRYCALIFVHAAIQTFANFFIRKYLFRLFFKHYASAQPGKSLFFAGGNADHELKSEHRVEGGPQLMQRKYSKTERGAAIHELLHPAEDSPAVKACIATHHVYIVLKLVSDIVLWIYIDLSVLILFLAFDTFTYASLCFLVPRQERTQSSSAATCASLPLGDSLTKVPNALHAVPSASECFEGRETGVNIRKHGFVDRYVVGSNSTASCSVHASYEKLRFALAAGVMLTVHCILSRLSQIYTWISSFHSRNSMEWLATGISLVLPDSFIMLLRKIADANVKHHAVFQLVYGFDILRTLCKSQVCIDPTASKLAYTAAAGVTDNTEAESFRKRKSGADHSPPHSCSDESIAQQVSSFRAHIGLPGKEECAIQQNIQDRCKQIPRETSTECQEQRRQESGVRAHNGRKTSSFNAQCVVVDPFVDNDRVWLEEGNSDLRGSLRDSYFSMLSYLGYMLGFPLSVIGPITTYDSWNRQMLYPWWMVKAYTDYVCMGAENAEKDTGVWSRAGEQQLTDRGIEFLLQCYPVPLMPTAARPAKAELLTPPTAAAAAEKTAAREHLMPCTKEKEDVLTVFPYLLNIPLKIYLTLVVNYQLTYVVEVVLLFCMMELHIRYMPVHALLMNAGNIELFKNLKFTQACYMSLALLMYTWLKFSCIWAMARLWSNSSGVVPVNNMARCILNLYSTVMFWRSWHRTYNLYIQRYLYRPLLKFCSASSWRVCVCQLIDCASGSSSDSSPHKSNSGTSSTMRNSEKPRDIGLNGIATRSVKSDGTDSTLLNGSNTTNRTRYNGQHQHGLRPRLRRWLVSICIFFYVALWHDLELKLFCWAASTVGCLLLEMLARFYAFHSDHARSLARGDHVEASTASAAKWKGGTHAAHYADNTDIQVQMKPLRRRAWEFMCNIRGKECFRDVCAAAGAINLFFLKWCNLIGYGFGLEGMRVLIQAGRREGLSAVLTGLGEVFALYMIFTHQAMIIRALEGDVYKY